MANHRHQPLRTCLVCRGKKPKKDLVRLVVDPATGAVVSDAEQSLEGRGAYACRECMPELRLNKRVQRAFRKEVKELRVQLRDNR
jgi:predicted RNA-binding protein YlxR (DUF448 family)